MIGTSTSVGVPFTPSWLEGTPDAPVITLRSGSVTERASLEAALSGEYRAGRVYGYELRAAVRSGVLALLKDDPELDHVLDLVERDGEGEAEELTTEEKALLTSVREVLAQHWADYRDLIAQLERRREIAPIVALKRFCTGITAKGVTFAVDRLGHVSEETLGALDPMVMMSAGNRAYAMLYPQAGDEGNLAPRSSSANAQATSTTDDTSPGDGTSAAPGGKKIRASQSRPGATTSLTSG